MVPAPAQNAPRRNRNNSRARQGNRKVVKVTGTEFRQYRTQRVANEDEIRWVRWNNNGKKEVDSIVHRYGREVGFRDANAGTVADGDDRMRGSQMRRGGMNYLPKSAKERHETQSMLECYALRHHPNDDYCTFLNALKSEMTDAQPAAGTGPSQFLHTRECVAPSSYLLTVWMQHLRDDKDLTAENVPGVEPLRGRMNKASTIDLRLKYISGTLMEFGQPNLKRSPGMKQQLRDWKKSDERNPASAFLFEETLPKLWDALWSDEFRHSLKEKVEYWARLLVQLSVIGRSSDVTAEYCPINETCVFPELATDYTSEGLPLWISVFFTNWKGRKEEDVGKPYEIRIHANPKDLRFCPVHWLIEHWRLRTGDARDPTAPILKEMSSTTWRKKLQVLFDIIGEDGSSHSFRRSGAMWAFRCGAGLFVIKNVGRWETVKHMMKYIAEGRLKIEDALTANNGVDPIFEFWPFSTATMRCTLEVTEDVLRALGHQF